MIVGAAGFLGSYLVDEILQTTDNEIIAVYRSNKGIHDDKRVSWVQCDITNRDDVDALSRQFHDVEKKIVFLPACHNPDIVFENPKFAWNVNIIALADFLNQMENVSAFIYPSTDSVYGNSINGHKYIETSRLNPVNVYGRQKVLAEKVVTTYGYNVVRLPFMIGHSLACGKKHFYDVIVETLHSGKPVEMFADSYRSTLSFRQVAGFILKTFDFITEDREFPYIINLCADDGLSKYDVGRMIVDRLGIGEELIKPIYLSGSKAVFKTPRADSTIMDNTLMKHWFRLKEVVFDPASC